MNQASYESLWGIFLKNHEPEFKKVMGYGKEEIEDIGVQKFFDKMGWTKEEQLTSYLSDRLHIVPCIDCGKEFAIYEEDLGLCESCQEVYDIDSVFSFGAAVAEQSDADITSTCNKICAAFYMSKEFRDTFRTDIPASQITHALVRKKPRKDKNLGWRTLPLGELKQWKECNFVGEFQLIRHDGTAFEKDGKTIFSDINEVLV